MESLLNSFGFSSWLGPIVVGVVTAAYIFSRVRRNDMDNLRKANTDLRDSLGDSDKKILSLEDAVHTLEIKVETLEKENRRFEDLIIVALKQYFFENPKMAEQVGKVMADIGK